MLELISISLVNMSAKGIKKLAVATPDFVSDCLETLEEIAIRGKEDFEKSGGEDFLAIPCLNDDDQWCKTLSN